MPLEKQQKAQLKQFGSNVQRLRIAKNITQEKLAELTQLNPRTIQKIEAGSINILLTTVIRIRQALVCEWDELFGQL